MSKQKMTPKEVAATRLSALMGEVLTVVEAVVSPVEQDFSYHWNGQTISATGTAPNQRQNTQREAVKDLVRTAFGRAQTDIEKWID